MAAPTTGWQKATASRIGNERGLRPAHLITKSLDDGEVLTVGLLNVAEVLTVSTDSGGAVKVSAIAAGVAADCFVTVQASSVVGVMWGYPGYLVTNNSGATVVVSVAASLTSLDTGDFPAVNEATFDGVESHSTATVA